MTDLIGAMVEGGAKYYIVTDVDRDGTMQGPMKSYLEICKKNFLQHASLPLGAFVIWQILNP